MRKDRIKRIEEVIQYLKKKGIKNYSDSKIHELARNYLKTRYGFSDTTIKDYIDTIIIKLKVEAEEYASNHSQ